MFASGNYLKSGRLHLGGEIEKQKSLALGGFIVA